jgi:hypothetical protein
MGNSVILQCSKGRYFPMVKKTFPYGEINVPPSVLSVQVNFTSNTGVVSQIRRRSISDAQFSDLLSSAIQSSNFLYFALGVSDQRGFQLSGSR